MRAAPFAWVVTFLSRPVIAALLVAGLAGMLALPETGGFLAGQPPAFASHHDEGDDDDGDHPSFELEHFCVVRTAGHILTIAGGGVTVDVDVSHARHHPRFDSDEGDPSSHRGRGHHREPESSLTPTPTPTATVASAGFAAAVGHLVDVNGIVEDGRFKAERIRVHRTTCHSSMA